MKQEAKDSIESVTLYEKYYTMLYCPWGKGCARFDKWRSVVLAELLRELYNLLVDCESCDLQSPIPVPEVPIL